MEKTSTTQPLMLKKMLSAIVFTFLVFSSSFASPTTTATIGNFVWVDTDGDGKQDSGEPGKAGVTVTLLNSTTGAVVATTTTNSSGAYSFTVSLTSCTKYKVQFGTPGQYTFTTKDASGTDVTNDSDADANGLSPEFTMCPGENNPCVDAGIRQSTGGNVTVGDRVWLDGGVTGQSANGRQDAGENGVPNMTVRLLKSTGEVVATTTTNSSGIYWFTNVSIPSCGQYKVQFGNRPGDHTFTIKDASGTTATNDNDADANGFTDVFTLCPGDYTDCIDAGIVTGGPLPIMLANFQGNYSNGVAKLTWNTSGESFKGSYDVERSADGVNFKFLSKVIGTGLSTGSTYTYNDNLPLAGNNFYRLKIYDGNNSQQYSKVILLTSSVKGINIKLISGNPFINQVKVSVSSENQAAIRVQLTDHVGRILRHQTIQGIRGSNEISVSDLGNLPKGVYNLEIVTGGISKSIKLMKD